MHLPGWAPAESGLLLPVTYAGRQRLLLEMGEDSTGEAIVAVIDGPPSSDSQMLAFVDERVMGLERSDLPRQINRMSKVSFDAAAMYVGAVSIAIDAHERTRPAQLELARYVITDGALLERLLAALRAGRGQVAFAPQNAYALARLAVKYATAPGSVEMLGEAIGSIERALLGSSALTYHELDPDKAELDEHFDAVALLVQAGIASAEEPMMGLLARAHWLYAVASNSEQARAHPQWIDFDEWSRQANGLTVEQMFATGFGGLATSEAISDELPKPGRGLLAAGWCDDIGTRLGVTGEVIERALFADQTRLAEEFEQTEQRLGISSSDAAAGWITSPFEAFPFVRLRDGRGQLWSPAAIVRWCTSGFYYRAMAQARKTGQVNRFTNFNGWLVESYAKAIVSEALPAEGRPAGAGTVIGEVEYRIRKRTLKSPDIALDYGQDLVLVEVRSGRFRQDTGTSGDPDLVREDLRRLYVTKAQQLSDRIDDLLAGHYSYPSVKTSSVLRIWPVLVTEASLIFAEPIYDWIVSDIAPKLQQPRVQPLTMLDLGDWEQFCGMLEAGFAAPLLLQRKMGGYQRLDWRRLVKEDPWLPENARASGTERRADKAFEQMLELFGWGGDSPSSAGV